MANRSTHMMVAALSVGTVCVCAESEQPKKSARPLAGAAIAACTTNLPDFLEPALHPNHRRFFHSLTFAGLLGYAGYALYKWEPDAQIDQIVRFALMAGVGACLIHLLLDARTPKGLPLLGLK